MKFLKRYNASIILALTMAICGCTAIQEKQPVTKDLKQQVIDTERAFAKTMADRDFTAFKSFLSSEAIFFSGTDALRGKDEISQAWEKFYQRPQAPFSWEPDTVQVLESGQLALSSGPVRDAKGNVIATFNSIWRLEARNTWRIVFDKGSDVCDGQKN